MLGPAPLLLRHQSLLLRASLLLGRLLRPLLQLVVLPLRLPGLPVLQRCFEPGAIRLFYMRSRRRSRRWRLPKTDPE